MKQSVTRGVLTVLAVLIVTSNGNTTPRPSVDLWYGGAYESNIFHSFLRQDETGDMLNELRGQAKWDLYSSKNLRHRLKPYGELELYPSNRDRNKSTIGIAYEPELAYARHASIGLDVDASRRNKDLVDDAGVVQARTLQKWEFETSLKHEYHPGKFRFKQEIAYYDDNYDERTDSITGVPLLSYDYNGVTVGLDNSYKLTRAVEVTVTYDHDSRSYSERRTYTVSGGAFVGRPFEIRNYKENTIAVQLDVDLLPQVNTRVEFEYANRKDNFENFYGYNHRQYRMLVKIDVLRGQKTEVSFRFRDKNYANYWNSRIGINNRVFIDYADFQIEHEIEITRGTALVGWFRNYNKVSNDQSFDYLDVTAGLGFAWEF